MKKRTKEEQALRDALVNKAMTVAIRFETLRKEHPEDFATAVQELHLAAVGLMKFWAKQSARRKKAEVLHVKLDKDLADMTAEEIEAATEKARKEQRKTKKRGR